MNEILDRLEKIYAKVTFNFPQNFMEKQNLNYILLKLNSFIF